MKDGGITQLVDRLKQIGFSDRAVAMIMEQIKGAGLELSRDAASKPAEKAAAKGLFEAAAPVFTPAPAMLATKDEDTTITGSKTLIAAGVIAVLGMIALAWTSLTSPDLTIMTTDGAGNTNRGLQAILLAAWVLLPPTIIGLGWRKLPDNRTARGFMAAFWGGVGVFLATIMLAGG